jgi:hypothetical protein
MENNPSDKVVSHNLWCSWFAGSLRGIGNGLIQSTTPVDLIKKTVDRAINSNRGNPSNIETYTLRNQMRKTPPISTSSPEPAARLLLRMLLPGLFSFETHHQVAHFLYAQVNTEHHWQSALNHSVHFAAGAAGGAAYGLALATVEQSITAKGMRSHILGHGALFGGYDCFHDIFSLLLLKESHGNNYHPFIAQLTVGLSGGFAGITQAWMKDTLVLSKSVFSFTAMTQACSVMFQAPKRMLRAFPPGAAAFLAYEYTRYLFVPESNGNENH